MVRRRSWTAFIVDRRSGGLLFPHHALLRDELRKVRLDEPHLLDRQRLAFGERTNTRCFSDVVEQLPPPAHQVPWVSFLIRPGTRERTSVQIAATVRSRHGQSRCFQVQGMDGAWPDRHTAFGWSSTMFLRFLENGLQRVSSASILPGRIVVGAAQGASASRVADAAAT